jgi:hypothetical protein
MEAGRQEAEKERSFDSAHKRRTMTVSPVTTRSAACYKVRHGVSAVPFPASSPPGALAIRV